MSFYLLQMIQSHSRFATTPNSGHTSRMHLVPWMTVTFTVHLLQFNAHPIETAKAVSFKTEYLDAHLICNLFLPILDGRGQQQICRCMRVLLQMGWIYPQVNTIWQMLGSLLPMSFWSLIVVYDTILLNGVRPMPGTFPWSVFMKWYLNWLQAQK